MSGESRKLWLLQYLILYDSMAQFFGIKDYVFIIRYILWFSLNNQMILIYYVFTTIIYYHFPMPWQLINYFLVKYDWFEWEEILTSWLSCSSEMKIYPFKKFFVEQKKRDLSEKGMGSKVGLVNKTVQALEYFLESPWL